MWTPRSLRADGPRYLALADRIQADVESGRLRPGMRLPAQRSLASTLGVDFTTVSRAYAEARRRGLVRGHVGRGTFVRERATRHSRTPDAPSHHGPTDVSGIGADLGINFPPASVTALAEQALAGTLRTLPLAGLLHYQPNAGRDDHRAAGVAWLARRGLDVPAAHVVITSGAQHGLSVLLTTLAARGDTVLTESVTYPVFRMLAERLGLRLRALPLDAEGITPHGLRDACVATGARLLYCTPTLQNPTTAVMSERRRREIAAVARAHDVVIVEDDTYGMLPESAPAPLAAFAPERTYFVLGLAKTVAPGLRIAYAAAPDARAAAQIASGVRATAWMATPLTAAVATAWIDGGTAARLLDANRTEAAARQAVAARCFAGLDWRAHPEAYHGWLLLPPGWSAAELVAQLRRHGIGVAPAESFHVGDGPPPAAVRVSLCAAADMATLEQALERIASTLDAGPGGGTPVL